MRKFKFCVLLLALLSVSPPSPSLLHALVWRIKKARKQQNYGTNVISTVSTLFVTVRTVRTLCTVLALSTTPYRITFLCTAVFFSSEIHVFRLIRCDTIFSFHSARCCMAAIRPAVCHFDMTEQQVPLLLLPHFSWNEEGRRKGRPLTRWWMGELKNSLGAHLSIHISFSIGANVSPPFRQINSARKKE